MIISMTGFGDAHHQQDSLGVRVEIRSVNSRFFKLNLRASDGCGPLETRIEGLIRKSIQRGTVSLLLRLDREVSSDDYRVNTTVLESYHKQLEAITHKHHDVGAISLESLLMLPGVVQEERDQSEDVEALWAVIKKALDEALTSHTQMRRDEGASLLADLQSNIAIVAKELTSIEERAPSIVEAYQTRVIDRLNKLLAAHEVVVEPADIVREVGIYAERTDFAEETVRLRCHLKQFDNLLAAKEPSGKKIDFLIQEMLRETNTIGSKANDAPVAMHVVEIKTAIERMREQIQNCE